LWIRESPKIEVDFRVIPCPSRDARQPIGYRNQHLLNCRASPPGNLSNVMQYIKLLLIEPEDDMSEKLEHAAPDPAPTLGRQYEIRWTDNAVHDF
jgi:hypothetical protein